jgi:D-cysteine desulfhydrase
MNLAKFPRRRYTNGITPIEKLEKLSGKLNLNVYIKRDDLLGLAAGGNKTRKLEFLMADALEKGADTIITCGAVQSNHCRLTLAASVREGLECHFVLEERVPGSYNPKANGNNLLYNLMGIKSIKTVSAGSNMLEEMKKLAGELAAKGRKPYVIPGGGSNEIGALGYVSCAKEITYQMHEMDLDIDYIVCTSGSAGTHAGLLAGLNFENSNIPVVGISISRKQDAQQELVYKLYQAVCEKLNFMDLTKKEDIIVFDEYVGEGYSRPTQGMVDAVRLLAETEAVLLDPVYTGKTMDGLIDLAKKGYFADAKNILFLHTGGSPALYAYIDNFI